MTGSDRSPDVSDPHAEQPVVTAGAPGPAADVAVVCCHGRGATAQGIVNLLDPVYQHGVAFLAPEAVHSSWYPHPMAAPREENEPWFSSSVDRIRGALESTAEIGIPPEKTVLGGFSQGACVVAEFVRRQPARYGGVFLLSGAVPGAPEDDVSPDGDLEGTPVFVGRGDADRRIDLERVAATARAFDRAGGEVDYRRYSEVGHEVTDDELEAVRAVVAAVLSE